MDFSRLRTGELIAAVGSGVLFIVMFFKWYGVTAWQAYSWIDLFLLLTIIVALGLAVLTATQRSPALPVSASVITATLGILGTLLVLYRIINQPGDNDIVTVKIGAYLGLVAIGTIAYGGWRSMSDEGTSFQDARTQVERAAGVRGESQPAPPLDSPPTDKAPTTEPPTTPPATEPPEGAAPPSG